MVAGSVSHLNLCSPGGSCHPIMCSLIDTTWELVISWVKRRWWRERHDNGGHQGKLRSLATSIYRWGTNIMQHVAQAVTIVGLVLGSIL